MSFLYRRIDRATWASAANTTNLTAQRTGRPRLENLRLCSLGYDPNMFRLLSHAHVLWGRLLEMRSVYTKPCLWLRGTGGRHLNRGIVHTKRVHIGCTSEAGTSTQILQNQGVHVGYIKLTVGTVCRLLQSPLIVIVLFTSSNTARGAHTACV